MSKVSPARSYPELFRLKGSLLSLVFRTEDVCLRCNQFVETLKFLIRGSPSHSYNVGRTGLMVSPSHSYNAGSAGLGWMSGWF
jgi:hypothetical protein